MAREELAGFLKNLSFVFSFTKLELELESLTSPTSLTIVRFLYSEIIRRSECVFGLANKRVHREETRTVKFFATTSLKPKAVRV